MQKKTVFIYILDKCPYEADEVQLSLNCCNEADIKGKVAVKNTVDEPENLREESKRLSFTV